VPTVRKLQELHPASTKCAPAILRGFPREDQSGETCQLNLAVMFVLDVQ